MKEIEYKCKTCMGCNRLENKDFKGTYRCENYVKGKWYGRRRIKRNYD